MLTGPTGLAARLARPSAVAWVGAVGAWALLLGSIAKQGGSVLTVSSSAERVISHLGASGGSASASSRIHLPDIAWRVASTAAGQVTRRAEEAEGRLGRLLARPVSRVSWLRQRPGPGRGDPVASGLLAGLSAWLGAVAEAPA